MVFLRLCSFLKHPFSSGFQDWAGIIWRKEPWNLSLGSVLLFGTKLLLLCLLCFSFSTSLVEFPWIPTSWPVPVSLCGRVSERPSVLAPGRCSKWLLQFRFVSRVVRRPAQSAICQLGCWDLLGTLLLKSYSSKVAMTPRLKDWLHSFLTYKEFA